MPVDFPLDIYANIGKRLPLADHYRFVQLPILVRNRVEYCDRISNSHPLTAKFFHPATPNAEKELLSSALIATRPMGESSATESDRSKMTLARQVSHDFHLALRNPEIFRYLALHAGGDPRIWQMLRAAWTRRDYRTAGQEQADLRAQIKPRHAADLAKITREIDWLSGCDEYEREPEIALSMRDRIYGDGPDSVKRLVLARVLQTDTDHPAYPMDVVADITRVLRKHITATGEMTGESLLVWREIEDYAKRHAVHGLTVKSRLAVVSAIAVHSGDDHCLRETMLKIMQAEILHDPSRLTPYIEKLYFDALRAVANSNERLKLISAMQSGLLGLDRSHGAAVTTLLASLEREIVSLQPTEASAVSPTTTTHNET